MRNNNKFLHTYISDHIFQHKEAPSEYCHNCNRSHSNDSPYFISLSIDSSLHVHRQRKFKFLSSTTNESNAEEITLCYKHSHHLVIENDYKTANKNQFV